MQRFARHRIAQARIQDSIGLPEQFNQFRNPPTDVAQLANESLSSRVLLSDSEICEGDTRVFERPLSRIPK
jgi:hypothetical protein